MSFIPFLRNFLGAKGHQAADGLTKALVQLDPESASQADLATMDQDLDRAGMAIQKLRTDLAHETNEFEHVSQQYHELMSAAELLQKKLDDPAVSEAQKASVQTSLTGLLNRIEHLAPDLDRDKHDVEATQALLTEAEQAYQAKAKALADAKQNLERARHELDHARLEEQHSRDRAEQAEVVAGLKASATSKLTIALNSLHSSAEDAHQRAQAADLKAKALTSVADAGTDANVAAALAEVRGSSSPHSLADRLAALKR
jgi:chromosome segregation ATPase